MGRKLVQQCHSFGTPLPDIGPALAGAGTESQIGVRERNTGHPGKIRHMNGLSQQNLVQKPCRRGRAWVGEEE